MNKALNTPSILDLNSPKQSSTKLKPISIDSMPHVVGGNNDRRAELQQQRDNLYGERDTSTLDCVAASTVGAGMSLLGPVGTIAGAGFAAYVCSDD